MPISKITKSAVLRQSKKPSSPQEGLLWYDTSSDALKQFKNGSFRTVQTDLAPIKSQILALINDIAENRAANSLNPESYDDLFFDTFIDESKISTKTDVSVNLGTSGTVSLGTIVGNTTSRPDDDESYSNNDSFGVIINPNKSIAGVEVEISSNTSNATDVYLTDESNNILDSVSGSFTGGDKVTLNASLDSGTDYHVVVDNENGNLTAGRLRDPNFPITGNDVDIIKSIYSVLNPPTFTSTGIAYTIKAVTGLKPKQSGSIESISKNVDSSPSSVQVYQDATLNGQDITYTVKDGQGNSETITQSEVGTQVAVSFTGTSMKTVVDFSGDGSNKPVLKEYGVDF